MDRATKAQSHSLSRRDFLKTLSGASASAVILGSCDDSETSNSVPSKPKPTTLSPRSKASNVFVNEEGMPLLVCVNGTDFETMLAAGLSQLGGLGMLIGASQNVLIKPNCNASDPYPGITDLNSLLSIIEEVKKVTSGTVSVGDQGFEDSSIVYGYSGMDPAVDEAGAKLLTLNSTYRVRRSGWASNVPDFQVYTDVYDSPVIINTCVLKRHHTAVCTCAIKNNVGAVSGPEAIGTRYYLHYQSSDFLTCVAEIAGVVNPELNIVDARSVLTVSGPRYEDGVVVDAHKIVLCGDIVATDAYCARILAAHDPQFSEESVSNTLQHAESLGMGTADLDNIQVIEIDA